MQRIDLDSLDSTSDEALRRARQGERGPLLITAAQQTAGRGRGGRTWTSPRGGVWMTLLWPATPPLSRYQTAPLLAGLAVVQALERHARDIAPDDLSIKWPNDVLHRGRKVAGILCQCELDCLLVGVGVNANFDAQQLPGDARVPAAVVSLDHAGFIAAWCDRMADHLGALERDGFTLRDAIAARLAYRGEKVEWQDIDGRQSGIVRDVDDQGQLVLEIAGRRIAISSGEVRHLSPT